MAARRRSRVQLTIPRNVLYILVLGIILSGVVLYIPPQNIYIIFGVFTLAAFILYLVLKKFIGTNNAILFAVGVGMGAFLYVVHLLDSINSMILVSLLVSIGLFMRQK